MKNLDPIKPPNDSENVTGFFKKKLQFKIHALEIMQKVQKVTKRQTGNNLYMQPLFQIMIKIQLSFWAISSFL